MQMDKDYSASICGVLAIRYFDPEFEELGLASYYKADPVLNMSTVC